MDVNCDYSKNKYPMKNRTIPNKATVGVQEPQGWRPSGSWSPNGCWVRNYVNSQWIWVLTYIPWRMEMRITGCWEIAHSPPPSFSRFWHWSWDKWSYPTGKGDRNQVDFRLVDRLTTLFQPKFNIVILTLVQRWSNIRISTLRVAWNPGVVSISALQPIFNTEILMLIQHWKKKMKCW